MAYRILTLSGGGIRGIFQAACLRELAKLLQQPLSECFELIAGTSTGAIIALGIALNIDPDRLVELYRVYGPKIFARRWLAFIRKGPRYSPQFLREALTDVFGNKKLKDCKRDVVITATTLNNFDVRVFTTLQGKHGDVDGDLSVVDVIMASCAAPTYFPPVRLTGKELDYVDGGIWANCPCLVAVMEAYAKGYARFDDIRIVEIGNGKFPEGVLGKDFERLRTLSFKMVDSLFEMFFATQVHMAENFLEKLIGSHNIKVLDAVPRKIGLDDVKGALENLPADAEHEARNHFVEIKQFLE